ncbi:unnamed protein product [Parascedosporium putredinis]|uniref:NACHT domain-containing protein n=1 Tax=Parascedosporium putredinis TaxID=1442378 RepID=A0A9P1M9W2_9PEZI|nr:unnamed protein product [Parascedosporium putredinis]CAI7996331.1 unnamed protein product [Parascedosporium putredinis]
MASDRSSDSTGMTDSGEELDDGVVVVHPDDVSNYNPEQILPLQPAVVEKIRVWLGPTDYNVAGGEYRRHLASHVVGTGTWLTATPTYQQWLHSAEHGLLWIKGIPGSGKSVMAATLADELARANPGSPPEALLRDWTHQLLQYSPPLQKKLAAQMEIERSRSIDSLSIDDMWNDLRMAFANLPGKVFCIADALDEMDSGHDTFLQALGALGQWRPQTVKVLITSRPVPTVELPLRTIPCLQLRLDEQHVDADIATYVNFTLAKSEIPKAHWPIIRDAVPGRANGLFLYAKLAMDAFLEPGADVDAVLSALPQDLNELYTGLLEEHARRSAVPPAIQHLILESITHAMRPLRLLELAEMIRVCAPDRVQRDIKATKDIIRSACGPLLQILVDETVSVVHHSFTEYLRGSTRQAGDPGYPILDQESTHANLALVCLSYLKSGSLLDGIDADGSCDSGDDASEIGDSGGHEPGPPLEHRYDPRSVGLPPRNLRYNKRIAWPFSVTPYENGPTPIWWAARDGSLNCIRALLSAGANPNIRISHNGETPLFEATMKRHHEAISILLEAGADPHVSLHGDNDRTPLIFACECGHLESVEVFLKFVEDIDKIQRGVIGAARCGRANVVRRLLEHPGVDVNKKAAGETPLLPPAEADRRIR